MSVILIQKIQNIKQSCVRISFDCLITSLSLSLSQKIMAKARCYNFGRDINKIIKKYYLNK